MRQDYAFLSGHKTKNKCNWKSPTPGKTVKGWENGGGDYVISKEAKLLFNFSTLLGDKIEFQCGCRLANGPLSEQAAYWQRMVKGMGRRDPHLKAARRKPVAQLLLGAAFLFTVGFWCGIGYLWSMWLCMPEAEQLRICPIHFGQFRYPSLT